MARHTPRYSTVQLRKLYKRFQEKHPAGTVKSFLTWLDREDGRPRVLIRIMRLGEH